MKSTKNELRGCFHPNSFVLNTPLSYQNVATYGTSLNPGTPGCRQSLSGSETDISTSTENLTHEEKYVLRNSTRQEPQGEETLDTEELALPGGFQGVRSKLSYASMDKSSCGTLIIHKDLDGDDEEEEDDEVCAVRAPNQGVQTRLYHPMANYYPNRYESELHPKDVKCIPKHYLDQSEVLKHLAFEVEKQSMLGASAELINTVPNEHAQYQQTTFFGADFDMSKLPPPPEYPGKLCVSSSSSSKLDVSTTPTTTDSSPATTPVEVKSSGNHGKSMGIHSRSQPDLRKVGRWDEAGAKKLNYMSQRPKTKGKASPEVSVQVLHQRVQSAKYGFSSSDILSMDKFSESLIVENRAMKAELDLYKSKVSRLQKFELDIQKIHQAYEDLVKSSQKRERLDHVVRSKLEIEIRRQQDINKDLKVQLDTLNNHIFRNQPGLEFGNHNEKVRHDLQCRDQLITQLIQQNKELTAAKERHEIELAAQRATLQEQRNHIEILDKALNNAQSNVVKLEEEVRKKQVYVDRVTQLQKALKHAQVVSERREQMERKLRNRLERDLEELRRRTKAECGNEKNGSSKEDLTNGNLENQSGNQKCSDGVDTLKRTIREKEEKIIALESEVAKWEQHYMEENTMRQIAIDAASMPKDAKIAALERTSQESEKMIAQARSEKLKQMDELHASNKKCADMEASLKEMESQCAERDAMIKVLQKQSFDRDLALQNAMMRSPRNPTSYQLAAGNSKKANGGRSNSLTASSPNSPGAPSSSNNSSTSSAQESLDDQLKKLDSELLSKDSIIQALRSEKAKYPNHYYMV